jgi:hypothetical protein
LADFEQVAKLKAGADVWNQWKNEKNIIQANLRDANLYNAQLPGAQLSRAVLIGAQLSKANLSGADLSNAQLLRTDLRGANLSNANLTGAKLVQANLSGTNLSGADLTRASLISALLIETNLQRSILKNCAVYGISAWNLNLDGSDQANLLITRPRESAITVDNLEVAQFIYLLLTNRKIRDLIATIGKKGVLILGRFTIDRKPLLDKLRFELREQGYVPIVFDFDRPTDRDFTETIMTLAGMCLFIIADITNPKSSPLELQATVPNYMIPFVPLIQKGEEPFAMFVNLQNKYKWVLPLVKYSDIETLLEVFDLAVIKPVLEKHEELIKEKAADVVTIDADELRKNTLH